MIFTVNVMLDADFFFQSVKLHMLTTEEQHRNQVKGLLDKNTQEPLWQ